MLKLMTRPLSYFNPRSREGSDGAVGGVVHRGSNFNPRSREGSDDIQFDQLELSDNFNPRSREGSDKGQKSQRIIVTEFQSTLPRRERRVRPDQHHLHETISIHAPAKGATALHSGSPRGIAHFNPRSREGSDDSRR